MRRLLLLPFLAVLAACSTVNNLLPGSGEPLPSVGSLAVLPVVVDDKAIDVPESAAKTVTAAIYGVLAESPRFRVVADLNVADALPSLSPLDENAVRAYKLGKAVNADSVLFGVVSRFDERKGSDAGVTAPAAVAIKLKVVSVSKRKVIWRGEFNEQQQSLSQNLLNFWQFWRGGPKWFTAAEFARLGVERMIEDLEDNTEP